MTFHGWKAALRLTWLAWLATTGLAFAHTRLGLPEEAGAQIWGIKGSGVASAQVLNQSYCPRRRINPTHNGKTTLRWNYAMVLTVQN